MKFTVYFPPEDKFPKTPVIYYLSGLACTDENFIQKAGAQRVAAELGVALVAPDTSPRGLNIEGEDDSWDFGTGAGFYLNASVPKWRNYRMHDYVTKELPEVLGAFAQLNVGKAGIMGHSMGGHGALVLGLRHPDLYASISAFSPICHPAIVPWGKKAFSNYLGDDESSWEQYDATCLVRQYSGPPRRVKIDQGIADSFLKEQLRPETFEEAAKGKVDLELRLLEGYDHSYFFVSTFVEDHLRHHARSLLAS